MEPGESVEDCIEPEKASCTMESNDVDMSSLKQEETEENKTNTKESPICENDSNFAVICSFIEQFGTSLDLHLDIAKLKSMLETNDTTPEELVELHIKLLRKRRKYIQRDKWEKALARFISEYSNVDAWELERYGYRNVNLGIRITAFKTLLEAQFDYNAKFKSSINAMEASTLRLAPIGRDIHGNQYWFQLDPHSCLRVYREEPDDENSWILICKDKDDLTALISNLKSQNLDQLKDSAPVSENISENEDSNLNASSVNIKEEPREEISSLLKQNPLIEIKSENLDEFKEPNVEHLEELISDQHLQNKCIPKNKIKKEICMEPKQSTNQTFESSSSSNVNFNASNNLSSIDSEVGDVLNDILDKISSDCSLMHKSFDVEFQDIIDLCNHLVDQVCANSHLTILPSNASISSRERRPSTTPLKSSSSSPSSLSLSQASSLTSSLATNCPIKPSLEEPECLQDQDEDRKESEDEESKSTISGSNKKRGRKPKRGLRKRAPQNQNDRNLDEKSESESQSATDVKFAKFDTKSRGRRGGGRGRGRKVSIPELEIIEKAARSPSPQPVKRQSRRIQALQEKKNAELAEKVKREQQLLEEMAKKMQANKVKSQENSCDSFSRDSKKDNVYQTEDSSSDSDHVTTKKQTKKRRKGKGGKASKAGCPWDSASSSEEEEEEEEEEEIEEEDDEVLQFDDNEDEFACEEPDPDAEPIILKRARTAKKIKEKITDQGSSSEAEEELNDDTPCQRCGKYDHPEWILLCDKCDAGFHTACLKPPLMLIPDGDWFCPPCENLFLLEKLEEKFEALAKALEKRELEEMRKQRLKQVAASLDALSKPKPKIEICKKPTDEEFVKERGRKYSRRLSDDDNSEDDRSDNEDDSEDESDESDYLMLRSSRSRKKISYQFTEYDEMINSAILDEGYDAPQDAPYGQSRGKDMATIEHALKQQEAEEREEQLKLSTESEIKPENPVPAEIENKEPSEAEEKQEVDMDSDFEPEKPRKLSRHLKKRRLNDLEPPSEDDDSDESFKGGSDTEVEDLSEESLEGELDDETEESNESWKDFRRSKKSKGRKVIRGKSGKKKGYRRDDFVVDSDDSDYGAGKRSRTRAAAKKRVSYKEFTSDEEEEEEYEWKTKKIKKRKLSGSETSDEEWEDEDDDDITTKKKKKKNPISDEDEEEEEEEEEMEEEEEDDEGENDEDERYDSEREKKLTKSKKDKKVKAKPISDEEEDEPEEDDEEEFEEKKSKKVHDKESPKNSKSPKGKPAKKFEMRGKPRLSKARMMSLAENSDDSQETKTSPDAESGKVQSDSICSNKNLSTERTQTIPSAEVMPVTVAEVSKGLPLHLVPQHENIGEHQHNIHRDGSVHPMSGNIHSEHRQGPLGPNVSQKIAPNLILPPGKPSALSQLTAFASKGPGHPGGHTTHIHSVNPNSVDYPSSHHVQQIPPHPASSRSHGPDKEESDYSIMSLDAYGNNQRQMKSMSIENYCPPTSSPSQLLHLESSQYNPQGPPPQITNMERFPSNFGPNSKTPDSRMPGPFHESIPPRDYPPRQPYPPQSANFPGDPRAFYDPQMMRPNHGNAGPYPHPNAHPTGSPYRQRSGPMHYGPNPGPRPGPGPGFYPQPGPGFYARPGHIPRNSNRPHLAQNMPPNTRPTGPHTLERPPPYPGPPHLYPLGHPASAMAAHLPPNAFYPHPGEFLPNGGFMIQNLLHAPLPNQPNPPNRANGLEGPVTTGSPSITPNQTHTNSNGLPAATQGANHPPPSQPPTNQIAQPAPISSPSD